jgi:hypothetical protein
MSNDPQGVKGTDDDDDDDNYDEDNEEEEEEEGVCAMQPNPEGAVREMCRKRQMLKRPTTYQLHISSLLQPNRLD